MSRIISVCVVGAVCACGLGAWAPEALGQAAPAVAQATLANPRAFGPLAANGTFTVNAYSEQNGAKNATVTPTVVTNGAARNPSPPPPPFLNSPAYYVSRNGTAIQVPTGRMVQVNDTLGRRMVQVIDSLGPTATIRNEGLGGGGVPGKVGPGDFGKSVWLRVANDQVTIASRTGQYLGDASAFINPVGQRLILAGATVFPPLPPPPGAAAGLAVDPFFVPSSGSPLTYDPVLNDSLQLGVGLSGGTVSWAVDSSVFTSDSVDNFVQDGTPLSQSLWFLSLGAEGPITSTSNVGIDFEINPLALNEITFPSSFLAGLGSFSDPTSEAALIDKAIDQAVASALTLNGNEVDLNGFNPFPAGTTFTAANGGVEYADGVNAGIVSTPEPSTWLLFVIGLFGLLGVVWRQRKLSVV